MLDALGAAREAEHAAQVRQVELLVELCGVYASVDAAAAVVP